MSASADSSAAIVRREAPTSWRVVPSTEAQFGAAALDQQVMRWEREFPVEDWKVALTTTEFLVHPDLRGELRQREPEPGQQAIVRFHAVRMTGRLAAVEPPLRRFAPLVSQRPVFGFPAVANPFVGSTKHALYSRYMHTGFPLCSVVNFSRCFAYRPGRHIFFAQSKTGKHLTWQDAAFLDSGFLVKWWLTPWPEVSWRLRQTGTKVPASDIIFPL